VALAGIKERDTGPKSCAYAVVRDHCRTAQNATSPNERIAMSYLPIETYVLPGGNVAHIVRLLVSHSGCSSSCWEVREFQKNVLVQRRNYTLGQEARKWVLSVGGKLVYAQ
jgi:hypothetical protein